MAKYKSLYRWMLLPMFFMQAWIFEDYWGDFSDNAWSVHVHYWTGTVWYIFLIIQPHYATHGQLPRHRTLGIIGMFMGGAVCLTAVSMLYRDIETTRLIKEDPGRFGPFQGWFFFGVAALEIVMMVAFGFAVIMSIIERKQLDRHAWWLCSWQRYSECTYRHANQAMAEYRHYVLPLFYTIYHHCDVAGWCLEIPATKASAYLAGARSKPYYISNGAYWTFSSSSAILTNQDKRIRDL